VRLGRCLRVGLMAAALHVAISARASDLPPPRATVRGDVLVLSAFPDLFARGEICQHLETGLTATLVLAVTARGNGREALYSSLRVDLRLDLWERRFHLATVPEAGAPATATRDELASWWRGLQLSFNGSATLPIRAVRRVQVDLVLIPFSDLEQRDARRWLGEPSGNHLGASDLASGGEVVSPVAAVIHAIVGSSIRRQPLFRWHWHVSPQGVSP
jgi:hypothetical protein